MALHLLKLCVGAESIRDLEDWIAMRREDARHRGRPDEQFHTTRMVPKRAEELLDGGSLFWVIKGQISARQDLRAIRPFTDGEGISRCHLVLEPTVVHVMPRPCRPFQGWRYLKPEEAPKDLGAGAGELAEMPEELRRELRDLGLL
ncbi:MAG: lysophospholipase [Hyphomicrobiales bacterium]|nr:lysophospholipase [Hyphomicrobiales bacterium]